MINRKKFTPELECFEDKTLLSGSDIVSQHIQPLAADIHSSIKGITEPILVDYGNSGSHANAADQMSGNYQTTIRRARDSQDTASLTAAQATAAKSMTVPLITSKSAAAKIIPTATKRQPTRAADSPSAKKGYKYPAVLGKFLEIAKRLKWPEKQVDEAYVNHGEVKPKNLVVDYGTENAADKAQRVPTKEKPAAIQQ